MGNGVFEVKAVGGNTHLGGDDWDQRIIDYLADKFQNLHGVDVRASRMALQRLKEASEKAKKDLSTKAFTDIKIPFLWQKEELQLTLSREQSEELTRDLLEKMIEPTKQALSDANLTPVRIDRVVLVGASPERICRDRGERRVIWLISFSCFRPYRSTDVRGYGVSSLISNRRLFCDTLDEISPFGHEGTGFAVLKLI